MKVTRNADNLQITTGNNNSDPHVHESDFKYGQYLHVHESDSECWQPTSNNSLDLHVH